MIHGATLLHLNVFGLTVLDDGMRPILLLKDDKAELTLPVPLHPLEAGMTLSQTNHDGRPSTPHKVTEMLLKSMKVRILKCTFIETRPQIQMVRLDLENHPGGVQHLDVRAEDAMSLCLQLQVPLFASREYILASRQVVAAEHAQMAHLMKNPGLAKRTHAYLM